MALPGLRRLDHVGFTVPNLDEADRFLVEVLGCEYLYSLGPFRHEDSDWMATHLNVHPRAVMVHNRWYRCGEQAVFEVFHYESPDRSRAGVPRNSDIGGHHVALYVDDLDVAVEHLRSHGVHVLDGPTASRGPAEGNRWIYFLSPWGMQFELVSSPQGKAWDRERGRGVSVDEGISTFADTGGAASVRVAAYLRDQILRGQLAPGERIRQEDVADRLGASRLPVREALRMLEAEGLTEHEPNKGARVPRLSQHEVEVSYRMRERLEPLALVESLPLLDEDAHARLADVQRQIEENEDLDRFLELDREFHLGTYSGCHIDPLNAMVTRLWNSTQHYRRAFVALGGQERMWVVNSEHRLLLDAVVRRDAIDAERFLQGHIRRTRIELGRHPEVFEASR